MLPEQFTQDPQRLARFEREAKLLASLNHPNIAAIHSFEHADGLCQVKAESGTLEGWNHFIEGIAFHLKSSVTLSGYTIGSP